MSLAGARGGDTPAWLVRYDELQASLFAALGRSLGLRGPGGRDTFGDLFQIAVTAAWMKERDGEELRNPRAYLRGVIVNQRKMQLRSERRHPTVSYDELGTGFGGRDGATAEAIADRGASVSEQAEWRELFSLVAHVAASIEPRAGTVWAMRFIEGLTPDEITAELNITHRHYARLLERARGVIAPTLAVYAARDWCPGWVAKFARLAAGRATPEQANEARAHLAACPRCRHAYERFTRLHLSGNR
jgi:RNA polymerase sigma factor (sigma-70 family)